MLLYHGSNVEVQKPHILASNRAVDFGAGFYTTSSFDQATRWAKLQTRRRQVGEPLVSHYDFNEQLISQLKTLQFETADNEWLAFVVANRKGEYRGEEYDLVIGPVANDRTMAVINSYMDGEIDENTAILILEPQNLTDQYCFRTRKAVELLMFQGVSRVG